MAEAALDFFNTADLPAVPVAVQTESLKTWARLEAKRAAAEAPLVAAFWAADGPAADGQKSMAAWLARFTRCTKAAARAQVASSFRVREHRHVDRALTAGAISASYGRWISDITKQFDPADRDAVEEILVEAAAGGALLEDLERLATAALRRLQPGARERDEERAYADRGVTLAKTFGGVGRLNGDLDAEATALAEQVIGALSTKMGPEDDRSARQRRHDALAEAFRRLIGSNLLPERGGAKPHIKVDLDLATLRGLPGAKQVEDEWVAQQAAALTRARLTGSNTRDLLADHPGQQPPATARPSTTPATATQRAHQHAGHPHNDPAPASDRSDSAHDRSEHDGSGRHGGGYDRGGRYGDPQPVLPGFGGSSGATLAGVGPISDHLAAALACDATMTPTVAGAVDQDALEQMTATWLYAHGLCGHTTDATGCNNCAHHPAQDDNRHECDLADLDLADRRPGNRAPDDHDPGNRAPGNRASGDRGERDQGDHGLGDYDPGDRGIGGGGCGVRYGLSAHAWLRLRETMLRWAIEVLSGPGGLASYLRTGLLDGPLITPSIVLDVGAGDRTVPAALERAVRRRDTRCRFPGCDHPAELSQVHHIRPRSDGGSTELWNLLTLCGFHHLIAVHTWGWTLRLNADGTTTATGPDGRIVHEHDPPGDPPLHAA